MTSPLPQQPKHADPAPQPPADTVEELAHVMPYVLPIVGGVLMFLLAFIAIYMA